MPRKGEAEIVSVPVPLTDTDELSREVRVALIVGKADILKDDTGVALTLVRALIDIDDVREDVNESFPVVVTLSEAIDDKER